MGWNYLSIPKLERLHRWSLGMDKWFYPTLFWACNYFSLLGLKLIHVSTRDHCTRIEETIYGTPVRFVEGNIYAKCACPCFPVISFSMRRAMLNQAKSDIAGIVLYDTLWSQKAISVMCAFCNFCTLCFNPCMKSIFDSDSAWPNRFDSEWIYTEIKVAET